MTKGNNVFEQCYTSVRGRLYKHCPQCLDKSFFKERNPLWQTIFVKNTNVLFKNFMHAVLFEILHHYRNVLFYNMGR